MNTLIRSLHIIPDSLRLGDLCDALDWWGLATGGRAVELSGTGRKHIFSVTDWRWGEQKQGEEGE